MSIDEITGNCFYKGNRQYQRFLDDEEKKKHPTQNAYCLTEDNNCKYHVKIGSVDFCKANIKEGYKK